MFCFTLLVIFAETVEHVFTSCTFKYSFVLHRCINPLTFSIIQLFAHSVSYLVNIPLDNRQLVVSCVVVDVLGGSNDKKLST